MLLLSRSELLEIVPMHLTINLIEEAFKQHHKGNSVAPLRMHVEVEEMNGIYLLMPSYMKQDTFFGSKVLSVYPENSQKKKATISSVYILNSLEDGEFLAIMDGSFLTGMRTGAASAVAAKYLARENSEVHGIIGAGGQALFQAEAISCVRDIKKIVISDLNETAAQKFAKDAEKRLEIPVEVSATAQEVAAQSDILTTITTAFSPIVCHADLKEGCHVNAVGAFKPTMQELEEDVILQSRVVVDTYDGCLKEAGDLMIPIARKTYNRSDIYAELGELVSENKEGRQSEKEITVFKSVGVAFEDLVTAQLAFAEAKKRGVGKEIVLTH